MGIKKIPKIDDYWSTNIALGCPFISQIMIRSRFYKINRYLHLMDGNNMPPKGHPNYDPLYKVRSIIDHMKRKFGEWYIPEKCLSIDEAMIAYTGRLAFKQYIPSKPTKWGIKVFEICESKSGYCMDFDVYTGKERQPASVNGLGFDVISSLMQRYLNRFHHVFVDRFFSGVPIFEYLLGNNTYACGTVMLNRKGLPKQAKTTKLGRGASKFYQKADSNLVLTTWRDKRQVNILSTNCGDDVDENGRPASVAVYNQFMGGVDLGDQLSQYYKIGRSGHKWWRYIMFFCINTAITNAWLLYKACHPNLRDAPVKTHMDFRLKLAEELKNGFSSRVRSIGRPPAHVRIPARVVASVNGHDLIKIDGRSKSCKDCSQNGRRTARNYKVQTIFKCKQCNVAMCKGRCFLNYHQ